MFLPELKRGILVLEGRSFLLGFVRSIGCRSQLRENTEWNCATQAFSQFLWGPTDGVACACYSHGRKRGTRALGGENSVRGSITCPNCHDVRISF